MAESKFEAASEKVQAKLQGPLSTQPLDFGNMVDIAMLLLELFTKCMGSNNGNASMVAGRMKSPGLIQRVILRRTIREHLGRRFSSQGERLERALIESASDADMQELVDLANESQDPTYY